MIRRFVMKKMLAAVLIAAAALFVSQANAAKVFFKSPVKYAGTGCKPGAYSFSGQGTDTLTFLFSAYDAAKPSRKAASKMERTACNFVVPVQVPAGYQVSTMTADWRGFAEGNTELHREYFFAGQKGPRRTTRPRGNFRERDSLMHATFSHCRGGVVPLRINSSVRAKSRPSYIAIEQMPVFHLKWRKCRQEHQPQ
jgi:hypothetical protein